MEPSKRIEIISAFGSHLEQGKSFAGRESELPFPKELIRQALAEELVDPSVPSMVEAMEAGFLHLEEFVSDTEFYQVQAYETALARAREISKEGDQKAALSAAQALSGIDGAVAVMKKISEAQSVRARQLENIRALRDRK